MVRIQLFTIRVVVTYLRNLSLPVLTVKLSPIIITLLSKKMKGRIPMMRP
jgi:hypothetical protein